MRQQFLIDVLPGVASRLDGALQGDRIPQNDRWHHQVEAAGAVALVLEAAVADCAEPVQEYRSRRGVLCFPLIQPANPKTRFQGLELHYRKP